MNQATTPVNREVNTVMICGNDKFDIMLALIQVFELCSILLGRWTTCECSLKMDKGKEGEVGEGCV